jgi:hypothetical protein
VPVNRSSAVRALHDAAIWLKTGTRRRFDPRYLINEARP